MANQRARIEIVDHRNAGATQEFVGLRIRSPLLATDDHSRTASPSM